MFLVHHRLMKMILASSLAVMVGLAVLTPLVVVSTATAATTDTSNFVPDIKLPGQFESEPQDSQLMGKYFRAVYIYMVYVVGVLAVVMLIYGGVKWVAAAGNAGQINDAKDVITNAIIGLVIGLTSFLLLNIINPKLLSLSLPGVTNVSVKYYDGAKVSSICPPAASLADEVSCGSLKQIRTETVGNEQVPIYCIGVFCNDVRYGKHHVCSIQQKTNSTNLAPGGGCLEQVVLEKQPAGPYQDITKFDVEQPGPVNLSCGVIGPAKDVVGRSCGNGEIGSKCYAIGDGKIKDSVAGFDLVNNLCCNGDTGYNNDNNRTCP